jgi:hypothetical protein
MTRTCIESNMRQKSRNAGWVGQLSGEDLDSSRFAAERFLKSR